MGLMMDGKLHKFVVLVDRNAGENAASIADELNAVPGVEVTAQSRSFIDLVADEEVVALGKLQELVQRLGAELHGSPEARLMDPIPPHKIP